MIKCEYFPVYLLPMKVNSNISGLWTKQGIKGRHPEHLEDQTTTRLIKSTQIIVTCSPNFDGKWHLRVCDTADVSPTSSFVKRLALIRGADSAGIYFSFRLCFFFFLDRSPASAGFSHLSRALSVKKTASGPDSPVQLALESVKNGLTWTLKCLKYQKTCLYYRNSTRHR